MEMDKEQFVYMIAVESDKGIDSNEFETRTIPASTWAVFISIGQPTAIQKGNQKSLGRMVSGTGYEHAGTAEIEVYLPVEECKNYKCEVWIPIKKILNTLK